MVKINSIQWKITGQTLFSGQAQVVKNPEYKKHIQYSEKFQGNSVFFRASASFSKIVNGEKVSIQPGFFLRRFRDQIRVPRISNRVPRIRENYHRVPKIRKNRVPRIREIGSLQIQTGFLTFSLRKP